MALGVKNPPANAGDIRYLGSIPGLGRFPWRRAWQPTPVFLPVKSHGQWSLAGYSPWGRKKLDTTEATEHTHTHKDAIWTSTQLTSPSLPCNSFRVGMGRRLIFWSSPAPQLPTSDFCPILSPLCCFCLVDGLLSVKTYENI